MAQVFTWPRSPWQFTRRGYLLGLLVLLVACGGGDDSLGINGEGCDSVRSPSATAACLADARTNRIALALKTGDSAALSADDSSDVIGQAANHYRSTMGAQHRLIASFYAGLSTQFDLVRDSFLVQPKFSTMDEVFPLVVGDKGNTLASISTLGGGRIVGYGYDILTGFDPNQTRILGWNGTAESPAKQTKHQPVFKRVLAWLVSGDVTQSLAAQSAQSLPIAWSSLPTTRTVMYTTSGQSAYRPFAADGLRALGIAFTNLQCDPLDAPVADCAAQAKLVVIGAFDRRLRTDADRQKTQTQLDRIKAIVAAKIPILYLNSHPDGGGANDFARATFPEDFARLDAMGFANGDQPDKRNYYILDAVGQELTADQLKTRNDPFNADLIARIAEGPFDAYTWPPCDGDKCALAQEFVDAIDKPLSKIKALLDDINRKGQNVFDPQVGNKTLQLLILWADAYRKGIVYPIDKLTNPEQFQKAYIADALVAYVRNAGSAQPDLGNFLGPEVRSVQASAVPEDVTVTLSGADGFTAMGRFALPGQALTLQLQNAPAAGNFVFFVNTAAQANTKLLSSPVDSAGQQIWGTGYRRPRLPRSPEFPLSTEPITIVSPYGGVLQLGFRGAQASSVVLKIQGGARQPFYDATQGAADANAFLNDFQTSKLGWLEIKAFGLEIHSLISKTRELLFPDPAHPANTGYPNVAKPYYHSTSNSIDMAKYLAEAKKYVIEDAYQLAGLQVGQLQLKREVKQFCDFNHWDCVNTAIHRPPNIQHYHSDHRANCGWMCSGNPVTSGAGFDPRGWGESHELGHNLQRFNIYGGTTGEVSNNIFPLHKKWRLLIDLKRDAIGYGNEMPDAGLVFEILKNAYRSAGNSVAAAKSGIWMEPTRTGRGMLYFYLQWPLIYAEIIKSKNPAMSDADALEAGWDIFTLLYLNARQVEAAPLSQWPSLKDHLGFSTYTVKPATAVDPVGTQYPHHDYLLVVLSLITSRDQTPIFNFWGVETSQAGKDQVAALRDSKGNPLRPQPVKFYATRCGDDLRTWGAVDMNAPDPSFPWPNEYASSRTDPLAAAKQAANATYCNSLRN